MRKRGREIDFIGSFIKWLQWPGPGRPKPGAWSAVWISRGCRGPGACVVFCWFPRSVSLGLVGSGPLGLKPAPVCSTTPAVTLLCHSDYSGNWALYFARWIFIALFQSLCCLLLPIRFCKLDLKTWSCLGFVLFVVSFVTDFLICAWWLVVFAICAEYFESLRVTNEDISDPVISLFFTYLYLLWKDWVGSCPSK